MAFYRLKTNLTSVYIMVFVLLVAVPELFHTSGICYKKYLQRTARCRKKIFQNGRVIYMDLKVCCRMKDAKAWRFKVRGRYHCIKCPEIIDGGWSQWTAWSRCPVTCDWGNHTRRRKCDSPVPQNGGNECKGEKAETRVCYSGRRCPIDGGWGPWGEWMACSKTCKGGGVQFRSRSCDSPRPEFGGRHCTGSSEESRKCNENLECPVHGNWGSWNAWSACSSECTSARQRKCDNPVPKHGGKSCDGLALQESSCPAGCSVGSGSGSGIDGSGVGSGSSGSGNDGVDVIVTGPGAVTVKPTKSTKNVSVSSVSGEGSGEGGSGSTIDDNESGDAIADGGSGKVTKSASKNVIQVNDGSGGSGYGGIDVIVEKAPQNRIQAKNVSKSSKKEPEVGSGEGASGSNIDDNESGDSTSDDGSGKITKSDSKSTIQVDVGSGGSGYSDIDVIVEKKSQNTVEAKDRSKISKNEPGWGKKFEELKT